MKPIDFRLDLLPLKDKIYRTGLRITLNAQEAEDLTQDTLLRVWSKRDDLQQVSSIEAYCLAVCRNLALDRMAKRENGNLSLEAEQTDAPDNARTPQEQKEHKQELQREMNNSWNAIGNAKPPPRRSRYSKLSSANRISRKGWLAIRACSYMKHNKPTSLWERTSTTAYFRPSAQNNPRLRKQQP